MRSANRVLLLALAGLALVAILSPTAAAQCWPHCELADASPMGNAYGLWRWFLSL